MVYLLEFIVAIIAIGLALNARLYYTTTTRQREKGCLSGCFSKTLVYIYSFGFVILALIHPYIGKSYYDYLSIDLSTKLLISVWLSAVVAGYIIESIRPVAFASRKFKSRIKRIFLLTSGVVILFFGIRAAHFFLFSNYAETTNGLLTYPDITSGIAKEKSSDGDRSGVHYYVNIDGEDKHVIDSKWWRSIGWWEEIEYAYNPHATMFVDIFQADRINFTIPGVILLLLSMIPWVLTLSLSWDGIYDFIRLKKRHI